MAGVATTGMAGEGTGGTAGAVMVITDGVRAITGGATTIIITGTATAATTAFSQKVPAVSSVGASFFGLPSQFIQWLAVEGIVFASAP